MASKAVNRSVYDGNACLLYDYMMSLTEKKLMQELGGRGYRVIKEE